MGTTTTPINLEQPPFTAVSGASLPGYDLPVSLRAAPVPLALPIPVMHTPAANKSTAQTAKPRRRTPRTYSKLEDHTKGDSGRPRFNDLARVRLQAWNSGKEKIQVASFHQPYFSSSRQFAVLSPRVDETRERWWSGGVASRSERDARSTKECRHAPRARGQR